MNFKVLLLVFVSSANSQLFDTLEVIRKFNYTGESHLAQTVDGYLLKIHRILPKSTSKVKKLPCFLMHGGIQSSMEYLQLRGDSLPFVLSDNGFDVYLGNSRGNQYSSHIKYDKNSSKFWDFSLHEIGYYDLPAMIDYVLNFTKSEKLFYVGLSQGAATGMILLSTRPEYNRKIMQVHLEGPAVFMGHQPNRILTTFGHTIVETFVEHDRVDLAPVFYTFRPMMKRNCKKKNFIKPCILLEFMLTGGNLFNVNTDLKAIRTYLNVFTPYASKKQLLHFLQLMNSEKFQQFDYGDKNLKYYGREEPPEYKLGKVTAPVYIYYGGYDGIVHKKVRI